MAIRGRDVVLRTLNSELSTFSGDMMMSDQTTKRTLPSRREFIQTSAVLAAGATAMGTLGIARTAHAAGDDLIKIGLIGCGGRGSGAAKDALEAGGNVKL